MVTVLRRDLPPPTGNSELSKNERSVPWACGRGPGSLLFIDTRKDGLKPEFPRSSTALERAWVPRAKASILLNESTIGPLGTKGKNPLSTSVPRAIPLESKCDDRAGLLLCWALGARQNVSIVLDRMDVPRYQTPSFLLTRTSQSGAVCFDRIGAAQSMAVMRGSRCWTYEGANAVPDARVYRERPASDVG